MSDEGDYTDLEYMAHAVDGNVQVGFRIAGAGTVAFVAPPRRIREIAKQMLEACDEADQQMPNGSFAK